MPVKHFLCGFEEKYYEPPGSFPPPSSPSPHRKHDVNLGSAPPLPGLPSPSSLRDATSPKVRGLGSPPSFPVWNLYALLPQGGAVRRCAETFRLCQGLPLWGSWREAPERARMLPGPLDPSLAGAYDGAEDKPNGGTHITSPRSTSPVPANRSPLYVTFFSGRSASRWRWRRG